MHIPILMYRHRHSRLQQAVSWDRNVAAFDFYTPEQTRLIIVAPNISRWKSQTRVAIIDVYLENVETGAWTLVDPSGAPIRVNGQPADWRNSSVPSLTWDVSTEPDPTLQQELKTGLHSERLASLFLQLKLNGVHTTSRKGLSERIPCESASSQCRLNLELDGWFPTLDDMKFITDKPDPKKAMELGVGSAVDELQEASLVWENTGNPTGPDAAARIASRWGLVTPGSPNPQGAVGGALAPGTDPGGIDFSTLNLRYLAEGSGGQLAYAFTAEPGNGSAFRSGDGQTAVVQSSDAFFVWLSLPESTFWVNLNPNEPDKIVDAKLGTTDVGRILLEADFQMKKVVARLIHPDASVGRKFWGELTEAGKCIDMRQWIVPKPATVYEQDGGLYIVDAPLEVKMETDFLRKQGHATSCTSPDPTMSETFRTLVLPKVEEAVNKAPEYAELRRVYLSRVAAQWYRERHSHDGALSSLINTGNVSAWPALKRWSPRQVFDQYVESYQKKEFDLTRQETRGGMIYEHTYTYGGVDFSKVSFNKVTRALFEQQYSGLASTVQQSIQQRTTDQQNRVWLGSTSRPVPVFDANAPVPPTSNPWFYTLLALPLAAWLVAGILLLRRRVAGLSASRRNR